MRILHLSKFDAPERGGVEKVVHELCVGMEHADVIAFSEASETKDFSYKIFRSPVNIKFSSAPLSFAYVFHYFCLIKSYDIIHLHHPNPLASALVCLFLGGKKLVVHWHSDILKQKHSYKLFKYLEHVMLKKASAIITTSPVYAAGSEPLAPFLDKVQPIPIGIDDCVQEPIDAELVVRIKQQYEGKKIIFSLGRLIYYKGYDYLIEAAQYLGDDVVILIAGSGNMHSDMLKKINEYGVAEKVKMLGYISRGECLAYYRVCDVFCMSSVEKTEAFGVVQLEAMCFSKPIISTRIPGSGVDWVNKDGLSGIIVPPRSGKAIAEAADRLFRDEETYKQMAVAGRKRYEELFTREKMVADVYTLYKKLL